MQLTGLPIETVAWVAGFAAVFITVLYVVKLRKRSVEVPFSPLWGRVMATKRRTTDWWRRFKRLFSWFVHILIAALLTAAMLGPHFDDEVLDERHVLILVDNSASMAATDVTGGHDRFEVAVDKAGEVLDSIGGDDRVMVALFNNRVQPLGPFVDDPTLVEAALRDRRVTANPTDLRQALDFAADSLRDRRPAEVVLITDGADLGEDETLDVEFGDETTVRHLKVGERSENLAITAFNARRYPSNRLDHEVYVEVRSFYDRPVEATLELFADDSLVNTKSIELDSRGIHRQFYPGQATSGERLEARVRLETEDARDVFPLDDRAFATVPPPQRMTVQLVSEGNLFLEGPLLLNDHLDVERIDPADYDPGADYDITIFDGVALERPAAGDIFYLDPPREGTPFSIAEREEDPIITDVRENHPLMRWISLEDINIGESSLFELTEDDDAVALVFGRPLLVARDDGQRREVALGFDVRDSDFALRVGFPVFVLNVIDYFAREDVDLTYSFATGETWSIPVDRGIERAEMTDPDGEVHPVAIHDGQALFYGELPGFHTLETDAGAMPVAANLANPEESDIAPASIDLDEVEVTEEIDDLLFDRRQLWIGLLLAAFALLFLEWLTYNRRWTV